MKNLLRELSVSTRDFWGYGCALRTIRKPAAPRSANLTRSSYMRGVFTPKLRLWQGFSADYAAAAGLSLLTLTPGRMRSFVSAASGWRGRLSYAECRWRGKSGWRNRRSPGQTRRGESASKVAGVIGTGRDMRLGIVGPIVDPPFPAAQGAAQSSGLRVRHFRGPSACHFL